MTRILDLRLILTRDDRARVSVDGRRLTTAPSTSSALRFIADRLDAIAPADQLSALASALIPDPAPVLALVRCGDCRELVRLEADGCPVCDLRRRENAKARALCEAAGEPLPASLRGPEAA